MMQLHSDYDRWHQSMASTEARQNYRLYPWHQTVLKLLPDLSKKAVLEIGCGRGDFARLLARQFPSAVVTATDFSKAAISIARLKQSEVNLTYLAADAQNLQFANDAFDYVVSCECLEHVESPTQMMSGVARCLRRGGEFILTTENYFNGMILAWLKSWVTGQPFNSGSGIQPRENFFLFWKVRKIIESAGLTITHMESNHFIWLLLPGFPPDAFFTEDFANPILKHAFRPFGRHFTYQGVK